MKKLFPVLTFLFIYFLISITTFSQWQGDVRLTNNPAVSQTSLNYGWSIAASGDTIHIQFFDERNGLTKIFYKRSTDKGITWNNEVQISQGSSYSERGTMAVNGPFVHEVWQDWRDPSWEIYYKRSTDAGTTWGSDIRLTNDGGNSWAPGVFVSGTTVHILWSESRDGNMEAYYKRSSDGGLSWGADIRLSNNYAESWYPVGAAYGSNVHVFWTDNRDGNFEIYYKRSTDGGLSWGAETRLTNTASNSQNPTVAVNGSLIHLLYYDDRDGNFEIYYKRSTDGGLTWGTDNRLSNASGTSGTPSVAVSGTNVHITWEDQRDGNNEIYYKKSTNGGLNWGTDTRLTNSSAMSLYASVCVSGTLVHVVWFDERDGNREIYYKRDPTGNAVPQAPAAPVLVSPLNGALYVPATVRFTWNKSFSAVTYRIQIALDSLFTNFVFNDSTLTDSTIVVANLQVNKYHWWRVNAKNAIGTSPYSSVWKFGTFFVGLKEISSEIPKEFKLFNNYPNPFNPSTKIRFDIPISDSRSRHSGAWHSGNDNVLLIIYDMLGQEITTLVNEQLQPGTYEIDFNGTYYPSGVYYYKINTGSFSQCKKMVLIK